MKGCLRVVLYVIGGFIILGILGAIFGSRPNNPSLEESSSQIAQSDKSTSAQSSKSESTPTATPEWMAPTYKEICNENITDVQQEEIAKQMEGKKIIGWSGKVYDVERSGDSYSVQVDIRGGIIKSRQVVILGIEKELAMKLNVDQPIRFDGTIESVEMFAGTTCNPINVEDATITVE